MKKLITIIAFILTICALCFFLYPSISNQIGLNTVTDKINTFNITAGNIKDGSYDDGLNNNEIDKEGYPIDEKGNRISDIPIVYKYDLDRLYKDSLKYNQNLQSNQPTILNKDYEYSALNLKDYGIYNGIYGYISAPSINLNLPIYLGANETNMSYGATHLCYTSLPIGGKNNNTVISGHTGYIGQIFFDNITNLNISDNVSVTNYWQTLNYKVIETKVVTKTETKDIYIQKGKDLLTLMTCISDGHGSFNRYIVVCERV